MSTPVNAPYKIKQREAARNSVARMVFKSTEFSFDTGGNIIGFAYKHTATAVRDGKLNKKSGRRLATAYK